MIKDVKILFIGGLFNDLGGKPSKIAIQIFNEIKIGEKVFINGGYFRDLEKAIAYISQYNIIFWFASVSNDKPKLINHIKRVYKECILITSKRNIEKHYEFVDIVFHALNIKSNLVLEVIKKNSRYRGRIFDPLGNIFLDYTDDFSLIGKILNKRVNELFSYTRIGSEKILDEEEVPKVPNKEEFFELIRHYAQVFHNLIHLHPNAVNRFFGNASFRCERGFPSFKHNNHIFVSRRNIDKRYIGRESFVCINARSLYKVKYFGDVKPSVDTPIQLRLYDYYFNINYMLHSHVYVKDAPFTEEIIPCGALQEFDEIIIAFPEKWLKNFSINLHGHGSLTLVEDIRYLRNISYIQRKPIENHKNYCEDIKKN